MEKRGSAHLEMILAFSIFLVVVVFILVYIRPLETSKLSEVAVISLKDSFVDNASTDLVTVFVRKAGTAEVAECAPDISPKNWIYKVVDLNTYYVYFSDEFLTNGVRCAPSSVVIGSISTKKVLSNSSLASINTKYYSNYSGLKEDLKIPAVIDFEIYTLDGEYNLTRSSVEEIDIIAKRYTLSVLNFEGDLINREFVFRVW
jgi:hypothetical protein